jgi:hypothetical protein
MKRSAKLKSPVIGFRCRESPSLIGAARIHVDGPSLTRNRYMARMGSCDVRDTNRSLRPLGSATKMSRRDANGTYVFCRVGLWKLVSKRHQDQTWEVFCFFKDCTHKSASKQLDRSENERLLTALLITRRLSDSYTSRLASLTSSHSLAPWRDAAC